MKKRKLIPLSMMLLCSVCFSSACSNSSTTNTNVIATVNGNKITAEGVYNGLLYNESTAKYVYDVLERALIQSAIPETNSMRTKVQNEVEKWRREIEDNATLNGTNYKEDLQLALENEGASSIEEYTNNKIYTLQKQYAKEKFLEANKEAYTKGYIDANYLYHVKDIQLTISTSSNKTDLYNLSMTEEEAERLYQALNELDHTYQIPIILKYFYQMRSREIADFMGLTVEAVDVRIHRAKRILKKMCIDRGCQ